MIPDWLHSLSATAVLLGLICSTIIVADEIRYPQSMWIMNIVWPVVALFGTLITVFAYFRYASISSRVGAGRFRKDGGIAPNEDLPFPVMVGKGAAHCGSGCCLGDIAAEWLVYAVPIVATAFGWHWLFEKKIYSVWIVDFIFAFVLGIAFQYFTIKPMRNLSLAEGLKQAVKADILSLSAWQVGMYGFMAFAQFFLFRSLIGTRLEVNSFEFWFMMQIAMVVGFVTSYPINWWLLRVGIKEKM